MQIMSEALGLMLSGTALMPATCNELPKAAKAAGEQIVRLARQGLNARDIVTMKSFENAIMLHATISGSMNSLLHLPAIAREFGIEIDSDTFERLHQGAHYQLDVHPAGKWPAQFVYYTGGVPAVMEQIKSKLNLDVLTVTGKTLGENLQAIRYDGFYDRCAQYLKPWNLKPEDIIRPFDHPIGDDGTIRILRGNLAPECAVVKHEAVPEEIFHAILRAWPFDSEDDALSAVLRHAIQPGDAVIIRYEGPRGSGMPEMLYTTEAIASDTTLSKIIALITGGRFSGATRGPAIGHVSLKAAAGGPVALIEENDWILLDIHQSRLDLVGTVTGQKTASDIQSILEKRKASW